MVTSTDRKLTLQKRVDLSHSLTKLGQVFKIFVMFRNLKIRIRQFQVCKFYQRVLVILMVYSNINANERYCFIRRAALPYNELLTAKLIYGINTVKIVLLVLSVNYVQLFASKSFIGNPLEQFIWPKLVILN